MAETRTPVLDNAKYLAIVLVACAHFWEPYLDESRTTLALYMFVYAFHMPVFIVVSGYLSKGFEPSERGLRRLVAGVLVPYLIFEVVYACFRRWADQDPDYPVNAVDPQFLNWFLIALFIWRLTAPLWRAVRWPLPLAIGVSVLTSVTSDVGPALDLQRVLQFLPFFVLGMMLQPHHFAFLRSVRVRWAAAVVAVSALVFAYWAAPRMDHTWFYHRASAQELGVPALAGAAMTLALFGCSVLLTACFLAWVPRHRTWFTTLGTGTLYGYLLHGFVAKGSVHWGWYEHSWADSPVGKVAVTAAAAVLVTVLCTEAVRRVFRLLIEPRMDWLLLPRPERGKENPVTEVATKVPS